MQITSGTIDTIYSDIWFNNVIVKVGAGSILLEDVEASEISIQDSSGNVVKYQHEHPYLWTGNKIQNGNGYKIENQSSENISMKGSRGDDIISNGVAMTYPYMMMYERGGGDGSIIFADAGNDSITNYGCNVTIIGGKDNDYINQIPNGTENLSYYGEETKTVFCYKEGDGNDTVKGFGDADTLQIEGNYSTVASGDNMLVQVGDGSILLLGRANKSVSIIGGEISQSSESNILQNNNNAYTYSGGNKNITNYATGEKLNWSTDLTGIDIFSGEDFIFNSSSGDLTIQNCRDKVVDFSYNGTTIAYLAKASGELTLDASSLSQFLILVGGDNASNNFSAGSGGSFLWGGIGGYDTLKGGTGADMFFFGKNDGIDTFYNASSSDVVNLYDVSINDITSLSTTNNQITIGLNTGASLQINSAENVSAKITMQEGSVNFNHSTGQWNLA